MKIHLAAGAAVLALLAVSACNNNNNHSPPFTGKFRVVNGITDSNGLDVSIGNIPTDTQNIAFDSASHLSDVPEGSYKAQLTSSSVQFTVDNVHVDHNNITTVFANGMVAAGNQSGFAIEENLQAPPSSGQFEVQFVNDARNESTTVSSPRIYLVAPGSGISGVTPATVAFGAASTTAPINAGSYEIIVTDAANNKVYDSGPAGVPLPPTNSNVVQIALLDASVQQVTNAHSPVSILVIDNNGNGAAYLNGQH